MTSAMDLISRRLSHKTTYNDSNNDDDVDLLVENENPPSREECIVVPDIDIEVSPAYEQEQEQQQQSIVELATIENTNDRQRQEQTTSIKSSVTCIQHFTYEIHPFHHKHWFDSKDPFDDSKMIDVVSSFAPTTYVAYYYKLFYCILCHTTLLYTIIDYEEGRSFYFAFLTNWGSLFCCLYSTMSICNTIYASRIQQPDPNHSFVVTCRIRTTWIMFTLAVQTTFLTMFLFWPLVLDSFFDTLNIQILPPGGNPNIDYSYITIVPHGVIFLFTVIDGMYINSIPLRLFHWYGFILPFDSAYIIWTIFQSFLQIENPGSDNDPTTNDDAIYAGALEWSNDWQTALFWSMMAIFVIGPIIYILLWILSNGYCCCCCCCYCCNKIQPRRKYVDSIESTDTNIL